MRVVKPLRNLPNDGEDVIHPQGLARLENLLQGHTRNQFHHDATGLVFLVVESVVNSDNRRVRQPAGRPDFPHKHLLRAVGSFLGGGVQRENLQGHLAADGGVGRPVNNPHGAPAQFSNDVVSSDLFHVYSSK